MESQPPLVSIIIPVFNAASYLEKCIDAIRTSSYPFYEIIVVDDGSTDHTAQAARKRKADVLHLENQSGPAAARNLGAEKSKGDLLLFVDSDVLIRQDTLSKVVRRFSDHPDVAAVFGSYDTTPDAKNFLSQYKNLVHHFVHQQAKSDAATFWAGCGAIRKKIFHAAGGFDQNRYSKPCIEDIELGYRLKGMGQKIFLDKDLQVTHLKEWRIRSLLRADIFQRAVPWTRLILERKGMINDLNLENSQKLSAVLTGFILILLLLSLKIEGLIYYLMLPVAFIMLLNGRLLRFFFIHKGLLFTIFAFGMHLFYYTYSGITFASLYLLDKLTFMYGRWHKRENYT